MLGKRERSQVLMPRTTSMASLTSAAKQGRQATGDQPHVPFSSLPAGAVGMGAGGGGADGVVPKDSGDLAEGKPTAFLKACGFCGRRLGPGKDTYIYRGEVAFCSQECRGGDVCGLLALKALSGQAGRMEASSSSPTNSWLRSGTAGASARLISNTRMPPRRASQRRDTHADAPRARAPCTRRRISKRYSSGSASRDASHGAAKAAAG